MSAPATLRAVDDLVAVVPVKTFALAKQRLGRTLLPAQREALARAMLCDVLEALTGAKGLSTIVVVTADPQAGALAEAYGARLLSEPRVRGLNPAVTEAAARLAAQRRGGMLVLPSDIPGLSAAEIDRLVAAHPPGRAVSLVPAHDGVGTNALLVTPPDAMPFSFGPRSFALHQANAGEAGLTLRRHAPADFPGLARDIDQPADLAALAALPPGAHTRRLLAREDFARPVAL
ncbi:2-phospho-L-lactate guanylyltransferase [Ancylobacter sp. WKF20]|uniref:2-phospho-L-lactate guanylyltransferase n=1 Tax=Ancylobacter sp. WKF20 TaxID=3039801 RepID=UPI0024341A57|nr:2-phospho-L-lactate guanylyltransferase [Ancylobacter sp. WKF20]WGD30693.1 2-phospho-L-lactate guanylyltransferase [Ancylobacter sp. WKF20]